MKSYKEVQIIENPTVKIGNQLVDGFMSTNGGIEWGILIFLTGTSGAGKTTFCKKLQSLISDHVSVFYSREMLSSLVKKQTMRLDIKHDNAYIADVKDYPHFSQFMEMVESRSDIKILILDSIQRIASDFTKDGMSEEAAMKHIYGILMNWKDKTNGIVILIGQVTKDGDFQGANFLKHDADVHVHMVFDSKKNVRTIETTKNRMGKLGKLYYEIVDSEETIKFYSEKEFEITTKNINFDDYLVNEIDGFIDIIDKKGLIRKELKEYSAEIYGDYENDIITYSEYFGKVVSKAYELLSEYNLQEQKNKDLQVKS